MTDGEIQIVTARMGIRSVSGGLKVTAHSFCRQGVLRGVGEQKLGAVGSLVGYYVVGLPLGYHFSRENGLIGFWQGFTVGSCAACMFNYSVYALLDWTRIKPSSKEQDCF
jgi:Na+-driven multidrug efflux pump